jgi:hypothetical protein
VPILRMWGDLSRGGGSGAEYDGYLHGFGSDSRRRGWRDILRGYRVFLDGQQVGVIRRGHTERFEVSAGVHEVFLRD